MLFNSFIYLIFLLVLVPLFYLTPVRMRNYLLLAASYLFYSYWDVRFCLLLLGSSLLAYFTGIRIEDSKDPVTRKRWMYFGIGISLTMLGFFKYFNFFVDSFDSMVSLWGGSLDFLHMRIILPVGISFFTFQNYSYIMDVYRGSFKAARNPLESVFYNSFFPLLMAGPIERAANLMPQIRKGLSPTRDQMREGVHLIVIGLFQKVIIGDASGRIVDNIFGYMEHYGSLELIMGLLLFTVHIYTDFAGYSNIARGSAKLVGVDLSVNFRQPYLARSVNEYWNRWHISLSSWLKDYIYIPLGGNRKGKVRTYINLFLTMLFAGLWHGAAWTFVLYGALHGIYLSVGRYLMDRSGKKPSRSYSYAGPKSFLLFLGTVTGTYILVAASRLLFRADDFTQVGIFLDRMAHWVPSDMGARLTTITLSFTLMMFFIDIIQYYTKRDDFTLLIRPIPVRWGVVSAMMLISLIYMFVEEPLPFVYFQF
ncbi:MAG: MBOAT family O-acyltransferase [Bacteroidia bacterium]|nr:MBOAT family O-acyltransferase [Bacteroidia bacterium]